MNKVNISFIGIQVTDGIMALYHSNLWMNGTMEEGKNINQ